MRLGLECRGIYERMYVNEGRCPGSNCLGTNFCAPIIMDKTEKICEMVES